MRDAAIAIVICNLKISRIPVGPGHASVVRILARLLIQRVPTEILVDVQNPLTLSQHQEVYADLTLLRAHPDRYTNRVTNSEDVLLVIEVAEHSGTDQQVKLPRYAAAGIAKSG
jgi:hypothetical protein